MSIDLLNNLKVNVPKANLEDFVWVVAGIPKAGKTTLFAKVTEKYFGDIRKSLLLAFEKGYQALRVQAQDINSFDDFEEVANQLIEHKDELGIEFLGIDTADVLWEMAQEKVIREWNIKNPSKRTDNIAGVGARGKSDQGFGIGYQLAKQKVRKVIDKLVKAGFGLMILTHSKDKEIEQKDGLKYDQLVVSLPSSAREVFINMADFIIFITIEKEKVGNEIETKRYMYFRTDGYVEAGSRFTNVPDRIEYDVDNFLEVFKNAVLSEYGEGVDLEKIKKEQKEEKQKEVEKFIEEYKASKEDISVEDLILVIQDKVKDLPNTKKKELANKFKEIAGTADFTKVDDIDKLKEILEVVKNI